MSFFRRRILSSKSSICNAASDANNNTSRSAATTTLKAEAEASFIKTSMFPAAGPFSGAMFHGGQFNITINTVNKSPGTYADGLISTERSYIRIKRILESSDDDGSPTLHRKTLPLTGFLKNIIRVIDFIMNKACLEFCRAT